MHNRTSASHKHSHSISNRLLVIYISSCFIIILIFTVMMFFKFQSRMYTQYEQIARSATHLMSLEINGDRIDDYIEENFSMAEYNRILQRFYDIRESYPDILYMYVYRLSADGGTVVFDLNSKDGVEDAGQPGELYEFRETFMKHMDDLLAGKDVPVIGGPTDDGYVLTYCKPIYDSNGTLQCHACVDFSIDALRRLDRKFIFSILLVGGIVSIIIMVIGIFWLRRLITQPLNAITKATEQFRYHTQQDQQRNIEIMEKLNITSNDEIGALYQMFVSVMKQSINYMESLDKAESDIRSKEEQIGQISIKAFKDELTSVGNKAAYNTLEAELNAAIQNGTAEFAIVMFDANNLKAVNDSYGHEKGDIYIKGCCQIICDTYAKSPVFRIGGDEFIAVLRGRDYEMRDELLAEITETFVYRTQSQTGEPWERFSMSPGMAEYISDDESVSQVMRRADAAMYLYKTEFKRKFGSYR